MIARMARATDEHALFEHALFAVTKVWAGSNEIMKEVIGRSLGFGDPGGRSAEALGSGRTAHAGR